MASLLLGTTIGGHVAVHANNISTYALTSVPSNVITTSGGQTIAGITYFSNGESLNLYGIRGRFTNEYIHLYNKVGIGHPNGWGQGEGDTPGYGLSTYGGMNIAYGNGANSYINGYLRINKNWAGGDFGAEQLTIRGTYPSIALRSTQHNSKWLIHHASALQFYYGGTSDDNNWANKFEIPTDGNIWMAWANDYISNLLDAKQNASTAITTSNIGSQSVNYASSAGSVAWGNVSSKPSYIMYYQGFTLDANTMDTNSTGFTYANNAPFYGPIARFSTGGGYDLWLGGSYNGGGNAFFLRTRDGDAATLNPWREIITSGNIASQSVNYASNAGNADTLDSLDSSEFARGRAAYQVLNLDTVKQPGLYQYDGGIGGTQPAGTNWYNVKTIEIGSEYRYSQFVMPYSENRIFYRYKVDAGWQPYVELITSGNIASQSVSYADESGYSSSSGSVEWTSVQNKPATFAPSAHTHDDRYYTESESDGRYVPYGSITGSFGLNDNKLYLRTNGDNNHYLWNASDDWEELNAYEGTGFRITSNQGATGVLYVYGSSNGGYTYSPYSFRAPIFYDSADTNYYVDPNSTSMLYRVNSYYLSNPGDVADNHPYGIYFSSSLSTAYAIFREPGAWNHPYPDLRIAFHTGIKIGANAGYEGVRFYTDYDMSSQVMSVNNGSDPLGQGNVYVNNNLQAGSSLRAPIFYDSADTTYYGDFAGTSWLRHLSVGDVNASNDGGWNARLNLTGSSHARLDVKSNSDGIITTIYSHTGQGVGRVGTWSNHPLAFMVNGGIAGYAYANYLQGVDSVRAPIFYDSADTAYYVDPNSNSKLLNLGLGGATPDLRLSVSGDAHVSGYIYQGGTAGVVNSWGSRTLVSGGNYVSNANSFRFDNVGYGSTWSFVIDSGGAATASASLRAPIFYDSNDTGYYLDPNGTSNLNQLNTATRTRWNMPRYWTNRTIYSSDEGYWTGTNGWGVDHGNWANAWQGGFSGWDIWGTNTDHPQGSGYVHAQGIVSGQHYATSGVGYGWMMVGAADAITNRYWLRGKWGSTTSAWTEIMTSNQNTYAWNMDQWVRTTDSVSFAATTSPTFLVNSHSDNTKGYRIYNTSNSSVSAMFVNSSNQLVIAAGAVDQINLNKKVLVNGVALGVNVSPSGTAGRIDASNDIVAYSSSDERLKQNITPIENALDKVKSLTGVEFDWKPEYKHAHGYEGHDTGIIAQQVQEVIPSAVRTNDTGFLAVRYEKLIGLLVEGMKEQQAQIEELKAKLDGLTK
jgi:hypothetical protein